MKKVALWVGAIGVSGALILLGWYLLTTLSNRRTHAMNMARAEDFRREFDQANPVGTSLDTVNEWIRRKGLFQSIAYGGYAETGNGDVFIQLYLDKSPQWYCSAYSVDLIIHFGSKKVEQTKVGERGLGCL